MKRPAVTALLLLGAVYAVCTFFVFRHEARDIAPGRVTIRICHFQLETGVREAVDAIIRRYEQINPQVRVVQVALPGGPAYTSWIRAQMVGGDGPDLAQYVWNGPDVSGIFQPISADVLRPNPYNRGTELAGVAWRDTLVDGMTGNFDRSLHEYYSVSMATFVGRIIYNRPLLQAITGRDTPPATYREMLSLCDQVRAYARNSHRDIVPMADSSDLAQLQSWLISIAMTGGLCERIDFQHRLLTGPGNLGRSYLGNDWSYDTPEAVAFLQELREFGGMCRPGFWAQEGASAVTDFVGGHAAMIVAPSWEATILRGLCPFEIAAFRFPYPREDDPAYGRYVKGPFSDGQVTTGVAIYLNRATRHRAAALDFMRFMTSQEGSRIFTQVSNWPPATIGVKPSAFASQFKLESAGYYWGGNLMTPTMQPDAENFIDTHLAELWNPGGGVDAFRKVMREGLGASIREDLRREVISAVDNVRRVDVAAAARMESAPSAGRPDVLAMIPIVNESELIYQNRALLAPPEGGPPPRPAKAADRPMAAADQTETRGTRFGRALSLLDRQPMSEAQVGEARRIFAGLAESGADDPAQGARFFLGRIAQHHQQTPDAVEAAKQYRRLIAAQPDSPWAQTAVPRLALLEIYALHPGSPPAERVARAEQLLASARALAAQSDLHLAIASAVFFYRLPAAGALPHLLAAERLGQLDGALRTEVLVQIAELSRLAGDYSQAARYYHTFLNENPIEVRRYLVRERLAAVEAKL